MKLCLVISDNQQIAQSMRDTVRELGFHCIDMNSCDDAGIACQGLMPDIIILDNEAVAEKGSDFIRQLRSFRDGHKPKVLFCSSAEETFQALVFEAGANGQMNSPLNPENFTLPFGKTGAMKLFSHDSSPGM